MFLGKGRINKNKQLWRNYKWLLNTQKISNIFVMMHTLIFKNEIPLLTSQTGEYAKEG